MRRHWVKIPLCQIKRIDCRLIFMFQHTKDIDVCMTLFFPRVADAIPEQGFSDTEGNR